LCAEYCRLQSALPSILSLADLQQPCVLDLIGAGLEGVHSSNLLKSIETDDDKAVVQFRRRRFLTIDLMQKETIQRQRLFVNDVAPR